MVRRKKEIELRFAALTIDWNDGMLEKWNGGIANQSEEFYHVDKELSRPFSENSHGLRFITPIPHYPNLPNPTFQYSIIPLFQLRSEAELSS
jgi:hypothetical protein